MARSARALVVELVADTKEFVKGTQDADRALDKFTRSGAKGLDALERKAQETSRDIAKGKTKEQFGEAGKEVGAEFSANLGQSLASSDVTTIAQDTAGGLVSAFTQMGGPIGIAFAGVATAATIMFAKIQKEAEQRRERIAAVFDSLTADIRAAITETERGKWFDKALEQLGGAGGVLAAVQKIDEWAKRTGVSYETVNAAIAEGGGALDLIRTRLQQIVDKNTTLEGKGRTLHSVQNATADAAKKQLDFLSQANDEILTAERGQQRLAAGAEAWKVQTDLTLANVKEINRQLRLAGQNPIAPRVLRG